MARPLALGSVKPRRAARPGLSRGQACPEEAHEAHEAAVIRYFSRTPELRRRLLLVDFAAADAGRALCEFILGAGHQRCASLSAMPNAFGVQGGISDSELRRLYRSDAFGDASFAQQREAAPCVCCVADPCPPSEASEDVGGPPFCLRGFKSPHVEALSAYELEMIY